jgi:hypothetical protein
VKKLHTDTLGTVVTWTFILGFTGLLLGVLVVKGAVREISDALRQADPEADSNGPVKSSDLS